MPKPGSAMMYTSGVTEEPEQVLPQIRTPTVLSDVERRLVDLVEQTEETGRGQDRARPRSTTPRWR